MLRAFYARISGERHTRDSGTLPSVLGAPRGWPEREEGSEPPPGTAPRFPILPHARGKTVGKSKCHAGVTISPFRTMPPGADAAEPLLDLHVLLEILDVPHSPSGPGCTPRRCAVPRRTSRMGSGRSSMGASNRRCSVRCFADQTALEHLRERSRCCREEGSCGGLFGSTLQ